MTVPCLLLWRLEVPWVTLSLGACLQDLIVASLQHLYEEYELDGFVFDRAENLTLDPHGASVMGAPLVEAIAYDYRWGCSQMRYMRCDSRAE